MNKYQIQANLTFGSTIKKVALKVSAASEDEAKSTFTQKAEANFGPSLGKIHEIEFNQVDKIA